MTQVDERTVSKLGLPPDDFSSRGEVRRWWWWPLAAGGGLIAVVSFFVGKSTAPTARSADPEPVETLDVAADLIEPGALVGPIVGANRYPAGNDDVARYSYAWPGQDLVAPEPSTGRAVAWQWQLCDVPPEPSDDDESTDNVSEEPPPLECSAVDEASEDRWASPPTNRTRMVRVIVTIDLGDAVRVRAATTPIAAVDWPDDIQPGDPPPEAIPDSPPVSR